MPASFWLVIICIIFIFLYVEKSYRLKKLKKLFSKMEHKFFKQQEQKEQFFSEMTKKDVVSNITLDTMTGLPDFHVFEDRLSQAVKQSQRHKMSFGVMILDINHFSALNEELGHDMGDKILIETANRLKNAIRQLDTVTRYTGNDFVFLLPLLLKPETAAYVAQRAEDNIMKPYTIDGKVLKVTVSMGIAIYPTDGDDASTLLKNAEIALKEAKASEKNTYQFFQKELQILGQRELSLTSTLRNPKVSEQLIVYYQPQINIELNQISCVQAILYLQHTEFGVIPFSGFYKLAENAGKIVDIGEWLLENAIQQFKRWEDEGFKPPLVSISVSVKQIENPRFLYKLNQVLQETGFDAKKIVFEISENILTENLSAIDNGFSMLTRLGIKISIGIFALGHFALSKISKIPIDYLKVDGKLIQDVINHGENEHILGMIISLAKDSQIIVIADGVDQVKQKTLLKQLGCTMMQGPLFGEPKPAQSLEHEYHS